MSYILEALKKSEQERELGQVPGLITSQDQNPLPRPRWVWPVVAVLLVNGLLLAWLMLDRRSDDMARVSNSAETAESNVLVPFVSEIKQSQHDELPVLTEILEPQPISPPELNITSRPDHAEQSELVTPRASAGEHEPVGNVVFANRPLDEFESGLEEEGTVFAPDLSEIESGDEAENEIPLWRELSAEFRNELPRVSMDVHVYAESPPDRFVLVNLRKYREGDTLEDGSVIEEITRAGMVLSYNGERFRITK